MKNWLQKTLLLFSLLFSLLFYSQLSVAEEGTDAPIKRYLQKYDWVQLTSGEWLQGDIISMYYDELEFDSDKLHMQKIDWDDVQELRSRKFLSVRMHNGEISEGYLVVKAGKINLIKKGIVTTYNLNDLLSIAAYKENEIDLWNGNVKLGATLRRGNTSQFDYNFSAGLQRRSSTSRLKSEYTGHYSNYDNLETGEKIVSSDNRRFIATYDWLVSRKIFIRFMDVEIFRDPFLNIDKRASYGVAVGYFILDNSITRWDIVIGPGYQATRFVEVSEGDILEKSPKLSITTDYTLEITKKVDFNFQYQVQWVNENSGNFIHHLETGFEIDLVGDFDLDTTFYLDRTQSPKVGDHNNTPEQNDYRLAISLSYDF